MTFNILLHSWKALESRAFSPLSPTCNLDCAHRTELAYRRFQPATRLNWPAPRQPLAAEPAKLRGGRSDGSPEIKLMLAAVAHLRPPSTISRLSNFNLPIDNVLPVVRAHSDAAGQARSWCYVFLGLLGVWTRVPEQPRTLGCVIWGKLGTHFRALDLVFSSTIGICPANPSLAQPAP